MIYPHKMRPAEIEWKIDSKMYPRTKKVWSKTWFAIEPNVYRAINPIRAELKRAIRREID